MKFVCPHCKEQVIDYNWIDCYIADDTIIQCPECHSSFTVNITFGWVSDVVFENKPKWTSNFTPPTQPAETPPAKARGAKRHR